jgi:hypothetical protein
VNFLMVVAGFPLLLAVLALGAGLLVEQGAGMRLPTALIPVCGFGVLIVVSQFTTWSSTLAPASPWILLALALAGFALAGPAGLAERWRSRGRGWWLAPAAALATYLTVIAPVLAAGRLTSPGYLLDSTAAIQLAGAERLLHYGRNFTTGYAGYGETLVAYFGNGYPSGGHTVLASVGFLSGQDLFWLYAPFQAMELALTALVLTFLASRAGLSRGAAALTGWIASVPALVYSYALMGSIKELTVLPMLMLMGALVVLSPRLARGGIRATLPFAVAAAASLGAIGIAASPWIGLFALAMLLFAMPVLNRARRARRTSLTWVAGLAGLTLVLGLPTLGRLSTTFSLATKLQSSNAAAAADPGNLLRPLQFAQTFGVWLGESHRADPKYLDQTYLLIGITVISFVLGLIWLAQRRAWSLLAVVLVSFIVWEFLTRRGTEWTNAKVLMLLSPVVVFVALVGALGPTRRRRIEGFVLSLILALAVLGSDALAYHATGLSPTQRYSELRKIGQRFAGQGPALLTDFDEYAMYFLRNTRVDAPGYAYRGPIVLAKGLPPQYGHSYDIDAIDQRTLTLFPLIVMRRSPAWSRPPSNYAEVWSGPSYEVWRRTGPPPRIHLPLGAVLEPVAPAPCRSVRSLARTAARDRAQLTVAERAPNVVINLGTASHSPNAVALGDLEGQLQYALVGPAKIDVRFRVAIPAQYRLWLGGNVDRPLRVSLDGRVVGTPAQIYGGDANKYQVATLYLAAGAHELRLIRGGGGLAPGDNASALIDGALLEPVAAERETVRAIPPSAWHTICGRQLDWIEVV